MPTLRELQQDFSDAVLHHAASVLAPHIRGPGTEERAMLYANTVYGTLGKALGSIYPVIARLVGNRCFDGLTRRFIREVPSRSGDLHEFGGEFADFITGTPLGVDYPYLPDVARLEWLVHRVFHARDAAPLDVHRLRAVPPERRAELKFVLAPASALLVSAYPVHRIWEANQPEHDGSAVLDTEETRLLVLRVSAGIEMISLSRGGLAFLSALGAGRAIVSALEAAMEAEPGFDPRDALAMQTARGTLVDFSIYPDPLRTLSGIPPNRDQ